MDSFAVLFLFFFNDTATTEIYTLSLHDALPISWRSRGRRPARRGTGACSSPSRPGTGASATVPSPGCREWGEHARSEEHTSELQSLAYLVCRLLLEKKNNREHKARPLVECD